MKYLIIGDAGSIFIKQYIEYVLLDSDNEIVLLQESFVSDSYMDFYKNNNVTVESLWQKKWAFIRNIPRVRSMIGVPMWCKYIKRKYGEFDCVHIHGVSRSRGDMALRLRKICKRMVVTVWGDELFRNDRKTLTKFDRYYRCADKITVATKKMYNSFLEVYGEKYAERLSINKFAIGLFEKIDEVKANFNRDEICNSFGIINPKKLNVLVGHNGRAAQRHMDITKSLMGLPKEYLDRITLVYTMTYGVPNEQYLDDLIAEAKALGSDVVVLRQFMDEETSAKLRSVCDVLLHAQLTDAFSASIQESLYSGSVILNGAWLPYEELPDYKSSMVIYDNMSDLAQKLMEVIDRYEEYRDKFATNKDVLKSLSSREVTTQMWKAVIDDTIALD